jgi:hypothetical protein
MAGKWKPPLSEPSAGRPYVLCAFDDLEAFPGIRKEAEARFGPVDFETESIPGDTRESLYGSMPRRMVRILSFRRPVGREELVDLRRRTLAMETKHQAHGRPLIELDPGYVSEFAIVRTALAEDFHRIYLYGGVFAETLYYFERLSFRPHIHTPQFFRRKEVVSVFNDLRLIHLAD